MKRYWIIGLMMAMPLVGFGFWPFKPKKPEDNKPNPAISRQTNFKPVEKEDGVSVEHIEKLAKRGNPNAMLALGKIYYDGRAGKEVDYTIALEWFRKAAELDNGSAMFNVGLCYEVGTGVEKDLDEAAEW